MTKERIIDTIQTPRCSIIIPVYNQYEYTVGCLDAIARNTKGAYEIILVDNGSDDETKTLTERDNMRIVRFNKNMGYAKGNNAGAKISKGEFLVFLNNDTIPGEGWIEGLTDVYEQIENVGIVGCMSLYPGGGRVQYAGMVFDREKNHYPLYSNIDARAPAVNRVREFQALAGVCLCIEKNFFHAIGDFDENLDNCYEDVDICLRVRAAGKKVVYSPWSRIEHFSSITLNADKRKMKKNMDKGKAYFYSKWRDIIENDDYIFIEEDRRFIEDHKMKYTDFFTSRDTSPDTPGINAIHREFMSCAEHIKNVRLLKDFVGHVMMGGLRSKGIRRIICFGASESGRIIIRAAEETGMGIAGIIDSNPAKQGSIFMGRVIEPPVNIEMLDADAIVICSTGFINEIRSTIELFNKGDLPVFDIAFDY